MQGREPKRDHGGGLDAAAQQYGGTRAGWIDLSTGINPVPYPLPEMSLDVWTALPDQGAMTQLQLAARVFWQVPDGAEIIAANGASALISRMPHLSGLNGPAYIPGPTYNEHAAAIRASGHLWVGDDPQAAGVHIYVHPNNPDGRLWDAKHIGGRALTIIDESFCDVAPNASHVARTADKGVVVLKSFGKFWGLAGVRLGFAIGNPETFASVKDNAPRASLQDHLGPWAVSGPALAIGAAALADTQWAVETRQRLALDAARMDQVMQAKGAQVVGGTTLFRLYDVDDAAAWQTALAQHHIWSRVFPYNHRWLRLGLPHPDCWPRVEAALS